MKARYKLAAICAALTIGVAHAACVNNPSDTGGSSPVATGKLTWHSYTAYADGSSAIFYRDLSGGTTSTLSTTGVTDPMNGVFSPDGTQILFMGIKNNAWNLFVGNLSGGTPVNLTNSTGTTRNEDPKLSADGTKVYWKQKQSTTYRLMSAPITWGATPSLGTTTTIKSDTTEKSMPFINTAGDRIYYSPGTGSFTVKYQAVASGVVTGSETTLSTNGYYPVVDFSNDNVFWIDRTTQGANDQLAYRAAGAGSTLYPSINNCNGNNSDPWPVATTNYVFFSATNGSGYQLYLGDLSNGNRYPLSGYYSDTGKNHLGSSYWAGTGGGGGGSGSCPSTGTDVLLSQGKTATASTQYNGTTLAAGKAVDGNTTTTRWDSAEPMPLPTWWSVDLTAKKRITGVDLYWDAAADAYTVDVSDDNTNWTTVYTQSNETSFSHRVINLSAVTASCGRYLRVNGTTADTAWGMALWEFQAWGF